MPWRLNYLINTLLQIRDSVDTFLYAIVRKGGEQPAKMQTE